MDPITLLTVLSRGTSESEARRWVHAALPEGTPARALAETLMANHGAKHVLKILTTPFRDLEVIR